MKLFLYCEIKSQKNPLEKTLEICSNTLFENTERNEDLSKLEFKELLSSATKESSFMFNEKLFKQVDGVAMGSPFGLTLAIACHVYLVATFSVCFKPHFYRRYVGDIFVLFTSPEH